MLSIQIMNPAFPKDRSKSKSLSAEQLDAIHDWLVERLNDRRVKLTDQMILDRLAEVGQPMVFDTPLPQATCIRCHKVLTQDGPHWVSTDKDLPQYCYVDPEHGSALHTFVV